jgi:hypothetical protein
MRLLGRMEHDECAPWCEHDPEEHEDDCHDSYCDGYTCWECARIEEDVYTLWESAILWEQEKEESND